MQQLAEYYAELPQAQRRCTTVFVRLDGHRNDTRGTGRSWIADRRAELSSKPAIQFIG
jgi:hypothetical protein